MGNRTLLEINHDLSHKVREHPDGFVCDLTAYLASGSPRTAAALERYGIRVFGMRHHSEGFDVRWGSHEPVKEKSLSQ